METKTKADYDQLVKSFEGLSVNKTLALNFILGSFNTQLNKGNDITTEKLVDILESTLRFSKVR